MSGQKTGLALILAAALAAVAVYWQTMGHEFIIYDTEKFIINNKYITAAPLLVSLKWAMWNSLDPIWQPITWFSRILDYRLFGLNPAGHHAVSAAIHIMTFVLMSFVLRRATGRPVESAFAAAIFALHPLNIESVAWMAERKDVLSAFFWWLSIGAYVRYAVRPAESAEPGNAGYNKDAGYYRYAVLVLCYLMALMSKAMVVTLPFVLLLLDYWPLGRLKIPPADNRGGVSAARLIYEKLPLFAMSAAVSVVTFMLQNEVHAVHTLESVTPAMRLYNSLFSHAAYIGTALWPSGLAIVHPYEIISASKAAASAALLLAISLAAAWRVKKEPYIIVGWLWFLGTLFPVNGLVQVGQHARSDRYMYLPSAGLYIMAVWALSHLAGRWKNGRLMLSAAAVVVVAALGMASWTELHYWRDNITLFKRSIELNKNNPIAYANLALALQKKGFKDEAIKNFEEAVRLKPNYPLAHHALGAILQDKGRTDEAIAHFAESIRLNPDDAYPRVRLGLALLGKGAVEDAGREFSEAMRIEPQNEYAHYNLGVVLNQKGRPEDAAREFEAAVRFKPDYAEALYNLGVATAARGRMEEAASYFSRAAAVNPSDEKAVFNLGVTLANMGKPTEAIRCFQEALRLKPDFAQARQYLNQLQINTGYGQ